MKFDGQGIQRVIMESTSDIMVQTVVLVLNKILIYTGKTLTGYTL